MALFIGLLTAEVHICPRMPGCFLVLASKAPHPGNPPMPNKLEKSAILLSTGSLLPPDKRGEVKEAAIFLNLVGTYLPSLLLCVLGHINKCWCTVEKAAQSWGLRDHLGGYHNTFISCDLRL